MSGVDLKPSLAERRLGVASGRRTRSSLSVPASGNLSDSLSSCADSLLNSKPSLSDLVQADLKPPTLKRRNSSASLFSLIITQKRRRSRAPSPIIKAEEIAAARLVEAERPAPAPVVDEPEAAVVVAEPELVMVEAMVQVPTHAKKYVFDSEQQWAAERILEHEERRGSEAVSLCKGLESECLSDRRSVNKEWCKLKPSGTEMQTHGRSWDAGISRWGYAVAMAAERRPAPHFVPRDPSRIGTDAPGGQRRDAAPIVGVSARTHRMLGGRLRVGTITYDEAVAQGLSPEKRAPPVDEVGVEALEAPVVLPSASTGPGLRAGLAVRFRGVGGLARAMATSKVSASAIEDLNGVIAVDPRYPLPSYKKDVKLILGASRPTVQRNSKKDEDFVEVWRGPMGEVPKFFAELSYDFGPDQYFHSKAVVSKHLGPSGDQRFNPAIRVPVFHWHPCIPKDVIRKWASQGTASNPTGIMEVFRAGFTCNRACQRIFAGKNQNGRTVTKYLDATKYGFEQKCSTQLKLVVRADDLGTAIIFQRGYHQGRSVGQEYLETSRLLRAYARDQCARGTNAVCDCLPSVDMILVVENWQKESNFVLPMWRNIRTVDIKGIFRARGIRNGMLGDPLVALEALSAIRHYDPAVDSDPAARGFVFFQPYIPAPVAAASASKEKAKTAKVVGAKKVKAKPFVSKSAKVKNDKALQSLLAVLASGSCCDDMIRWARINGIGVDSSHRHKCENRAPMTVMCTMADDGHVRIGPCAISSDITAPTLALYLTECSTAIEKRADVILEAHARGEPVGRDAADQALLLQEATLIAEHVWAPSHVMIDKSRAELNAIRTWAASMGVEVNVRLCQFHIIQAILRWTTDAPNSAFRTAKKDVKISRIAKLEILDAFRALQRYRVAQRAATEELPAESDAAFAERCDLEWTAAVRLFGHRIADIAEAYADEGEADIWYDKVMHYFEDNWFTPEWRDLWVDHGQPLGITRDGFWGQNNRTERLFKTFDDVFLGGTCNRRIDHLPLIIIDTLFMYFANFSSTDDQINDALLEALDLGAEYWESAIFERNMDFERAYWVTPLERRLRGIQWYAGSVESRANVLGGHSPPSLVGPAISGRNFKAQKRSATVPPREPEPWRELKDSTVKRLTTLAFNRPDYEDGVRGLKAAAGRRNPPAEEMEESDEEAEADDDYRSADADETGELDSMPTVGDAPPLLPSHLRSGTRASSEDGVDNGDEVRESDDEAIASPLNRKGTSSPSRDSDRTQSDEAAERGDGEEEGACDFEPQPKIAVRNSLPSAGADRAIAHVNVIRRADPSAVAERTSTKTIPTVFTNKGGRARQDMGHNSLTEQSAHDLYAQIKAARKQCDDLEALRIALESQASTSAVPVKGKSRPNPNPKVPPSLSQPSPPTQPPATESRVPNVVRNAGKTIPLDLTSSPDSTPEASEPLPARKRDVQLVEQAAQTLWDEQEASADAAYYEDNPFARRVEGCGRFDPDGPSYWSRFDVSTDSDRTGVTTAFLREFKDILIPAKTAARLRSSRRAKIHLTPITTCFGDYKITPGTLHQMYQMTEWLDDRSMDPCLALINFWLGWEPDVVGWSPPAYVLPTTWTEDNSATAFASDVRTAIAVTLERADAARPEQTYLSRCRYIIAPRHVGGNHWILVVACLDDHSFRVYDSMSVSAPQASKRYGVLAVKSLIAYLNIRARYQRDLLGAWDLPDHLYEKWDVFTKPTRNCPQQADTSACGPYTIFAALAVARHAMLEKPSTEPFVFEWARGVTNKERMRDVRAMRTELLTTLIHMRWRGDPHARHGSLFKHEPVQVHRSPTRKDLMEERAGPSLRSSSPEELQTDSSSVHSASPARTSEPHPRKRARASSVPVHAADTSGTSNPTTTAGHSRQDPIRHMSVPASSRTAPTPRALRRIGPTFTEAKSRMLASEYATVASSSSAPGPLSRKRDRSNTPEATPSEGGRTQPRAVVVPPPSKLPRPFGDTLSGNKLAKKNSGNEAKVGVGRDKGNSKAKPQTTAQAKALHEFSDGLGAERRWRPGASELGSLQIFRTHSTYLLPYHAVDVQMFPILATEVPRVQTFSPQIECGSPPSMRLEPPPILPIDHLACQFSELHESLQEGVGDLQVAVLDCLELPRKASRSARVASLLYITGLLSHPRWLDNNLHRRELAAHLRQIAFSFAAQVIAQSAARRLPPAPFELIVPLGEERAREVFLHFVEELVWKTEVGIYFAIYASASTIQHPVAPADVGYHTRWYGMYLPDLFKVPQLLHRAPPDQNTF
ncbi:hypothetical protein P7C70_g4829, partial [Phenoliferia sp. Uapishka_3]